MKLLTSLSFDNLIDFYQKKHHMRFNNSSITALKCIFARGVDISRYVDPKYDYRQLSEIYAGICENLDVSLYDHEAFDADQMWELRQGLKDGLDITIYRDADYSNVRMSYIRQGLEDGIDVTYLLNKDLDPHQAQLIDVGLHRKLDVSKYANSQLPLSEVKSIFIQLEKEQELCHRNQLFASSVSFKALIEEYESKHDKQINLNILKTLYDRYTRGIELTDETTEAAIDKYYAHPRLKSWYEIC